MVDTMVAENMRIARQAAGEGLNRAWRSLGKPWRLAASLGARSPERLLISPQDIRTADPTVAADIYAGYYAFAGKIINTHGRSVFELTPPSTAWAAGLAGFAWLRHLRAADTALARANARALVDDWMNQAGSNPALPVWEPKVAARRLLSWLSQSPMILDGADSVFYRRFMKSLGRHGARLQSALGDGLQGEARLLTAIALAEFGLCSAGMGNLQKRGTQILTGELTRQILADGGHIGRNPQTLVDLLLDLLPLRQAYAARGAPAPKELLNAIDRMMPMLRLFRMGGGSLALFNGMGGTQPHVIATVFAYDDARAAAPANAPYSGYQRLEAGGSVLVMDTGPPPPPEFSGRAHAGQLAFEWSSGGQPLIGNCGSPDETRAAMRAAARATAAHSTLTVAHTSSSRFAPDTGVPPRLAGRIISGIRKVTVSRQDSPEGPGVVATHDGYVREFGLIHERGLQLAADGSRLSGADRLAASGRRLNAAGPDYELRFHVHPAVRAERATDSRSVSLHGPDGSEWVFQADGLTVEIEPGIYFAAADGARPAEQIVVRANAAQAPGISWSFERTAAGV